jgi:hypothetical protein
MLFAIVGGVLVLLLIGLVVAISTAVQARRALEDLEDEFAEHRGVVEEVTPPTWSASDLALMRDEVVDSAEVATDDPYATLMGPDDGATWHAMGSESREREPKPWTPEPKPWTSEPKAWTPEPKAWEQEPNGGDGETNGSEPEPNGSKGKRPADLAPIEDLSPYAWRASDDAPVIVLVVGAGFLGTGVTAGLTTSSRLRRVWGNVNSSFAESDATRRDADRQPAPRPSQRPGARRDDVATVDARSWSRPERPRVDGARRPEADDGKDSRSRPTPRSNPSEPKPSGDPRPIVWRAPTAGR